jgi:hypothetical protein
MADEPKPVAPFDEATKARADALAAAISEEWNRWGRKAPVVDRILLSSLMPGIESDDQRDIEAVAMVLLEHVHRRDKRSRASQASLGHLVSRALQKCLKRGFPSPPALTELAALLLESKRPRHMIPKPEERQRVIAYVAEHPKASRRDVAKATGVSDATVRKWLGDPHFVDQVNERAGKIVLSLKSHRPGTQKR